ncbi:hypothetical protein, partial [Dermacoccus nishinomiyaensis]|uniref:hypothetical protein n=1 Tax=Dermacoccus nishinomiyaensis TaxID=1274 RepID=UPI001C92DF01
ELGEAVGRGVGGEGLVVEVGGGVGVGDVVMDEDGLEDVVREGVEEGGAVVGEDVGGEGVERGVDVGLGGLVEG